MLSFQDIHNQFAAPVTKSSASDSILASHEAYQPFITEVLSMIEEYYTTVIKPRLALQTILQKERFTDDMLTKSKVQDPLYTYLVNLVPKESEWPYPVKPSEVPAFAIQGALQPLSWHPNVAMQCKLLFKNMYDYGKKEYTNHLVPEITLKVWGKVEPVAQNDKTIIKQLYGGYKINEKIMLTYTDGGWDKMVSMVDIYLTNSPAEEIKQNIILGFSLITQNILDHSHFIARA